MGGIGFARKNRGARGDSAQGGAGRPNEPVRHGGFEKAPGYFYGSKNPESAARGVAGRRMRRGNHLASRLSHRPQLGAFQRHRTRTSSILSKVGQCFQPVHSGPAMHVQIGWKHDPTFTEEVRSCSFATGERLQSVVVALWAIFPLEI